MNTNAMQRINEPNGIRVNSCPLVAKNNGLWFTKKYYFVDTIYIGNDIGVDPRAQ